MALSQIRIRAPIVSGQMPDKTIPLRRRLTGARFRDGKIAYVRIVTSNSEIVATAEYRSGWMDTMSTSPPPRLRGTVAEITITILLKL